MQVSFIPGKLFLTQEGKEYRVALAGEVVLTTSSQKLALRKFNEIRERLEKQHPPTPVSPAELLEKLGKQIGDNLVDRNHYEPQQTKKPKGRSRTFG